MAEEGLGGKGTAKIDDEESGLPSAGELVEDEERIDLLTPPAPGGVTNDGAGIRKLDCRSPTVAR